MAVNGQNVPNVVSSVMAFWTHPQDKGGLDR
jgi:hypothetical protein